MTTNTTDSPIRETPPGIGPGLAAATVITFVVTAIGIFGWFTLDRPPATFPPASRSSVAAPPTPISANGMVTDPLLGTWSARNGTVVIDTATGGDGTAPSGGPLAVALTPLKAQNGFIAAKGAPVTPGWAMTFRWLDRQNHGWLRVAPNYAAVKVGVTVDGVDIDLGTFSPIAVEGSTFEIDVVDDEALVWVRDQLVGRVDGVPIDLGQRWGVMGDNRAIGVAGWAGAIAGPVDSTWLDDKADLTESDDRDE